jgi:ribonucleoside-diphosphate reductase alpha chain
VRFAKSIVDYIFRWMASKFLSPEAQYVAGVNNRDDVMEPVLPIPAPPAAKTIASESATTEPLARRSLGGGGSTFAAMQNQEDAPPCSTCGSIMVRSGACYKCANCGTTSGCA